MDDYRAAVIVPGDEASRIAKRLCFLTHENSKAIEIIPHQEGNFRGAVGWRWKNHILEGMIRGEITEEVENDGAGGKPQFFSLLGTPEVFYNLGWEIIEMVVEDLVRSGRFPALMVNELEAQRITQENIALVKALFEGYVHALGQTALANITGEVAVMRHSVTAFCDENSDAQLLVNWGASCIGLCHKDKYIDGSKIEPRMPIVGFWEPGYRCNGGTFFTKVLLEVFGPEISKIRANSQAMSLVEKLVVPSRNYSKTILRVLGWNCDGSTKPALADVRGIAHITGGGVWEKLGDLLPQGVGAMLHKMPSPATVLREFQDLSWGTSHRLDDLHAYGTLHGGCGMHVVCANDHDAQVVIEQAENDQVQAQIIGRTTDSSDGLIIVNSRFREGVEVNSQQWRALSC